MYYGVLSYFIIHIIHDRDSTGLLVNARERFTEEFHSLPGLSLHIYARRNAAELSDRQ
jgi:hypothetical protein